MSAEATKRQKMREAPSPALAFSPAKPVKSNPGAGLNGRVYRPVETRDGASSAKRQDAGEPSVTTCPCCGAKVRTVGTGGKRVRLEIVRYTKPAVPWIPPKERIARGSRLLAERAIKDVCEANAVTLPELWVQNHDPSLGAIRREAAKAARETGAAASTIGLVLHRNESTINKLAPKGRVQR